MWSDWWLVSDWNHHLKLWLVSDWNHGFWPVIGEWLESPFFVIVQIPVSSYTLGLISHHIQWLFFLKNNRFYGFKSLWVFLSGFLFLVIVTKNWSCDQFLVIVTNFWSSWPKFGHDDNSNCHLDQILVNKNYQNLVTLTIPIVIVTKNWSQGQLELSSWPNFCHDYQK